MPTSWEIETNPPFSSTDSFLKQIAKKQDSVLSGSTLSAYKVL